MSIIRTVSLDEESDSIYMKIPEGLRAKFVRESIKFMDKRDILPTPIQMARFLDSGKIKDYEILEWINIIESQIESRVKDGGKRQ